MNRNDLPTVAELYELEERLFNRLHSLIESSRPKAWVRTPELKKILGITDSTAQRNKVEVPH